MKDVDAFRSALLARAQATLPTTTPELDVLLTSFAIIEAGTMTKYKKIKFANIM